MWAGLMRTIVPFRHRVLRAIHLPKADLVGTLYNMAQRGFRPVRVLDIGANRGTWTIAAMRVFPDAEYLLLEPQFEMKPDLDRLCRRAANVRWMLAGVAGEIGELVLTVNPDTVSSTFSLSPEEAAARGLSQRTVPVTTIDHLVERELGAVPDLVKIDAEGFDMQIIEGAGRILGKTEAILMEANLLCRPDDPCGFSNMVTRMSEFGYEPYDFSWFGHRPLDGAVGLCEIVFVRRDGILRRDLRWTAD